MTNFTINSRHDNRKIDDMAGDGVWHLEDMGEGFYFECEDSTGDLRVFEIVAENGKVVVKANSRGWV